MVILLLPSLLLGQSTNAAITGQVADPSKALIPQAKVTAINNNTNVRYDGVTNGVGTFLITSLPPGEYRIQVEKMGFRTIVKPDVTLHVQDTIELNFEMALGSASETVTVEGGAPLINTESAAVSTVVDRRFVENMPLNGRSFQSLILLTPGTVTASPQRTSGSNFGELSVNGQRTESNYYTVDGVSAMSGIGTVPTSAGTSGSLPAYTALGTTQALVSVDALQEFRVESSTYSAEFGRNPGAQVSMVTRSGTNDWHGTAFDYLRNDVLDANDWFSNSAGLSKSPERQNDFGGTLGGPLSIPGLYNGKDRTFFFFSYEGLRLVQPQAATINYVPNLGLRQSVTGALHQVLNAFPLPTPNAPNLGGGLGEFIASWSNPSHLDATSIRLDQTLGQRIHLFFRFSDTPSSSETRGTATSDSSPSTIISMTNLSHSYTFGATLHVAHNVDNDFRLNFNSNKVQYGQAIDSFGGAVPLDLNHLTGVPHGADTEVDLYFGAYNTSVYAGVSQGTQRQWNLVDTVNVQHGKHAMAIGIDWRRLAPILQQANPLVDYEFDSAASLQANSVDYGYGFSYTPNYPVYTNFSLFIQDAWRVRPRLNISMGVRWDINPAPGVSQGMMPYTVTGLNNYATMRLAPQGTPLWRTSWYNFAPRLGIAYVLNPKADWQTVIRGGGGVFFDTGQQTGSSGFNGPGFSARNLFGIGYGITASFPVPVGTSTPAITVPPTTPYGTVFANPPHFQLPYTLQWNASLEQALGRSQSFTISYVGAKGKRLLDLARLNVSKYNSDFTYLYLFENGLTSNYNALQLKYQRQVTHGLEALASYTWSHSLDYGSYNAVYPYQYGNSDFDVRHSASAALSYDLPHLQAAPSWLRALVYDLGVEGRLTARTGFPVFLNGNSITDPATQQTYFGGLNIVPGVSLFLYDPQYPGGRRINPAAFSLPAKGTYGNAPRNFIRGFGAVQTDIAIRRSFPIRERLHGQVRVEAFNVFNHPSFGTINTSYGNVQFGKATGILSQSLGTLSPLYQMGGPRSLQLSLKLTY
jgi:hypothetical protein